MWTKFDYQNPPKGDCWLCVEFDVMDIDQGSDGWLIGTHTGATGRRLAQAYVEPIIHDGPSGEYTLPDFLELDPNYPTVAEFEHVTHYMPILPPELPKEGESRDGTSVERDEESALIKAAYDLGLSDGAEKERARLLAPFFEIGKLLSDMKEG